MNQLKLSNNIAELLGCHFLNHARKNYSAKNQENITLEEAIEIIEGRKSGNPSVLKVLSKDITIRKGKYGPYVY